MRTEVPYGYAFLSSCITGVRAYDPESGYISARLLWS